MIQEHLTTSPEAVRFQRFEEREWIRKQARVQREFAAVQGRWARSLSPRVSERAASTRDDARLRAR